VGLSQKWTWDRWGLDMSKFLSEIMDDLRFIKSHSLQPDWYKVFKIFLLLGVLIGYGYFFGIRKTIVFFVVFMILALLVHVVYRVKTNKWQQSWLDFVVVEENNEIRAESIGKFYYAAILLNAILSLVISQVIA
jgi:hypothetical protein